MKELLKHLICPSCKGTMSFHGDEDLSQGSLICNGCKKAYKVFNGIPRFVEDHYCDSFGIEWNTFRRTQLDSYSNTTLSKDRFMNATGFDPAELKGKKVLEIGSGAGRFLEVLAKEGVEVFGIDMSNAVDAAKESLSNYPNVHLAQADLFKLPFKQSMFDLVYTIGVLHHTPDTRKAFHTIVPYAKKGSPVSACVYGKSSNIFGRIYDNLTMWHLYKAICPRLPKKAVLKILRVYVPVAFYLSHIPLVGRFIQRIFPVWDYSKAFPHLSHKYILEWALLDTFDAFTPRYQRRHTWEEVRSWFKESGLTNIRANKQRVSYTGYR